LIEKIIKNIGNLIGITLKLDLNIAHQIRVKFARFCVEVP